MYGFNIFCKEQNVKIAKNLLLNKMCDNCYWLHGGVMECGDNIDIMGLKHTTKPLPTARTCPNWKPRYS